MTDLATIAQMYDSQDTGAPMEVLHPVTDEPIGLTITVAGYSSERMKAYSRKALNERIKAKQRTVTVEQIERDTHNKTAHAILSWKFAEGVTLDGEQPSVSKESIDRLFKLLPFVSEQIEAFANDLSNYAKAA